MYWLRLVCNYWATLSILLRQSGALNSLRSLNSPRDTTETVQVLKDFMGILLWLLLFLQLSFIIQVKSAVNDYYHYWSFCQTVVTNVPRVQSDVFRFIFALTTVKLQWDSIDLHFWVLHGLKSSYIESLKSLCSFYRHSNTSMYYCNYWLSC